MPTAFRPFGPVYIIGLLVIVFAILGMMGVVPFTPLVVFGMIALICLGFAF